MRWSVVCDHRRRQERLRKTKFMILTSPRDKKPGTPHGHMADSKVVRRWEEQVST